MKVSELIARLQGVSGDLEVDIFVADASAAHYPVQGIGYWDPKNGNAQRIEVVGWSESASSAGDGP